MLARESGQRRDRLKGGFTAIELMFVVLIVAILATLAAPSFRQLIAKQRVKSAASALTESLWVARSEAVKRNTDVSFKFTNAGSDTTVAEWKITQSSDGSGTALHQQDGFPAVVSTTSSSGNVLFTFNAYGRLTSGGSSWIKFSVPSANVNRWVCVSTAGRAIAQDTACS
jgi:type IV fimbrial biogenesis protein FimT